MNARQRPERGAAAAAAAKQNDHAEHTPDAHPGDAYSQAYADEVARRAAIFDQCSDAHWAHIVTALREVHNATKAFHAGDLSQWRYASILRDVAELVTIPRSSSWTEHGRRRAHTSDTP